MKKHYIIFILAILAIVLLQIVFIESLYENHILNETNKIDNALTQAIDLEAFVRKAPDKNDVKFVQEIIPINEIPKKTLDSILAIYPLPKVSSNFNYDIRDLMDKNIILSSSEIIDHISQDMFFENKMPIELNVLDSLFNIRLGYQCDNKLVMFDSEGNLIASYGSDSVNYNYTSDLKQMGLKGYQFLQIHAYIPVSNFIKRALLIITLSLIIILIPLICLMYQLTTIRRKTARLENSENSINGIIHGLKSPLSSTSIVLDLFSRTEIDKDKKELIQSSSNVINNLIQNIESLLNVTRHDRKKIVIYKEEITIFWMLKIINIIKTGLKLNYQNKIITIDIVCNIPEKTVMFVDKMHFESIVRNLVENAIKYSDNKVNISITLDVNDKNKLKITVSDNGWGIKKKYIKHMFKQFYRAPRVDKSIKGYGIGLAFVKAIAKSHGGSVIVNSIENKGSEFIVILNTEY